MAQTVIGVFNDATQAQRAVQQLETTGIDRENIYVSDRASDEETAARENEEPGFFDSIGNFFRSVFDGSRETHDYDQVARRNAVVTVYTPTRFDAERVADILDECGAVDVDQAAMQHTNTITTEGGTLSRSGAAATPVTGETATDRVMQYGDSTDKGDINTGIYPNPVATAGDSRTDNYPRDNGNTDTRNAGDVPFAGTTPGSMPPNADSGITSSMRDDAGYAGERASESYRTRSRIVEHNTDDDFPYLRTGRPADRTNEEGSPSESRP